MSDHLPRDLPDVPEEHRRTDWVEREFWLDDPKNVRFCIRIFALLCVGLWLWDVAVQNWDRMQRHLSFEHSSVDFPYEGWWNFYGLYGLGACVLLVLIAKQLRKLLMRPEDYYERDDERGDGDA